MRLALLFVVLLAGAIVWAAGANAAAATLASGQPESAAAARLAAAPDAAIDHNAHALQVSLQRDTRDTQIDDGSCAPDSSGLGHRHGRGQAPSNADTPDSVLSLAAPSVDRDVAAYLQTPASLGIERVKPPI